MQLAIKCGRLPTSDQHHTVARIKSGRQRPRDQAHAMQPRSGYMEDNTNACAHMQTHMYTLRWTHHAARLQTWKTADMHASPYQTQIHFLLSCWSSMILSP